VSQPDQLTLLFIALLAGFGGTVALTPAIIRLSIKHHWLDLPDERRIHREPVPRIGGVAIFIVTVVVASTLMAIAALRGGAPMAYSHMLPGVAIGATIVFLTGLFDDLRGISPRGKLLAQTAAALVVVGYGFKIDVLALTPDTATTVSLGLLAVPVTVLWIVGVTNAFNLIDGSDGLAGTVALVALATTIGVDLYVHNLRAVFITVAMLGAVLGFLRFNHNPARIFLGDSGSMTLGFFLSIRLVIAATAPNGRLYFIVPIFALAFPLLDTGIAIARRWLRGHAFSRADGRHIHHQILALGLSPRRTAELIGVFFAGVAAIGISVTFAPPQFTFAVMLGAAVLAVVAVVYGLRWLRYGEFSEFAASVASVVRNARIVVQEKIRANDIAERIKKCENLDQVRAALDDLVDELRVLDVELVAGDVHVHGPERQRISPNDRLPIRLDYPFAWETPTGVQEVILRLWSTRPTRGGHPASERVATRIGPALEEWFKSHPREATPIVGVEVVATTDRRTRR